jgi:hypothetical protein
MGKRSTTGWIQVYLNIDKLKVQSSPYRDIRYQRTEIVKIVLKSILPQRFHVQPRGKTVDSALQRTADASSASCDTIKLRGSPYSFKYQGQVAQALPGQEKDLG